MQAQQAMLTFNEAERSLGGRLLKIALEIDRVEGYSEPHAIAIAWMAEKIGERMGLHGVDLTALKFAALAHDLGERAMKRDYLLRPEALNWDEVLDLWRHPILGEQAASELKLPRQTQLLIRWSHEWWNGAGYPDGLAREAIPLGARILRAVDTYFALISDRPHRRRFERSDAEQIIADMAGIEFDPCVVKLLLQVLAEESSQSTIQYPAPVGDEVAPLPVEYQPQSADEAVYASARAARRVEIPDETVNLAQRAAPDLAPPNTPAEAGAERRPEMVVAEIALPEAAVEAVADNRTGVGATDLPSPEAVKETAVENDAESPVVDLDLSEVLEETGIGNKAEMAAADRALPPSPEEAADEAVGEDLLEIDDAQTQTPQEKL